MTTCFVITGKRINTIRPAGNFQYFVETDRYWNFTLLDSSKTALELVPKERTIDLF